MNQRDLAVKAIDSCGSPLHPLTRKALIEAVDQAISQTERAALQFAAEHLRKAMEDVERAGPITDCTRHLLADVRRLADEVESLPCY